MKIYVVTREGIYRHEILGLYLDPKESEKNAYLAISSEKDDYHEIFVMACETDKPIEDGMRILRLFRRGIDIYTAEGEKLNANYSM